MKVHMQKIIHFFFLLVILVMGAAGVNAQEYRAISGENNNSLRPAWGSANGPIKRLTEVDYQDGISLPGAVNRANPREISNQIFNQSESINEFGKHSDYVWVFGQFIDHDITLIRTDASEPMLIPVPECDEYFDPNCTGQSVIPLNRSIARPGTGTTADNPREYNNAITAFIDGSNIYGSDEERATYLRSFVDGKLRTSHGDLLPFNTVDGEFNSGTDVFAPEMDMINPDATKYFIAGDVRANENVLLSSMHTIFVREHNRWTDVLKAQHPGWSDETLYQEAKLRTSAILQSITYEEWLPSMGIILPAYAGYSPNLDPSIIMSFSSAAFRLGHTMLNSNIKRMMENCEEHPNGDLTLMSAFFNPIMVLQDGGVEPLLRGMAAQDMQEVDGKMIDDVRNFLFGAPGSGIGMDLASINIQRGREMGLPDFNSVRKTFGLPPYRNIDEICPDAEVTEQIKSLYGSVENIDAWVGMLIEVHMNSGSMFGRTIVEILKYQFTALRDGDRFYYENSFLLSDEEKAEIKRTTLGDVIKRNSSLRFMQDDVFMTQTDCEHTNLALQPIMLDAIVYPNPANEALKVGIYSTIAEAELEIRVVDNLGRFVQVSRASLVEGMNIIPVDITSLLPGNYLLHLTSGAAHNQQQFVKL
jgi:hypothetical protein